MKNTLKSWINGTSKLNVLTYSIGIVAGLSLAFAGTSAPIKAAGVILAAVNVYGIWKHRSTNQSKV